MIWSCYQKINGLEEMLHNGACFGIVRMKINISKIMACGGNEQTIIGIKMADQLLENVKGLVMLFG